jgi:hypothetical protein
MIKHEKSLRRKLDGYLREITRIQPKTGKPICPGLAEYRHQVQVQMAELDLENQLFKICSLMYPMDIPAVVIVTTMPPTDLYEITDDVLNNFTGIEIFVNDPNARGAVNGIYTGFAHGWLIIVQREDILENARNDLKQ